MTDMNKVLILTGGYVDIQWAKEWLADKKFDYCIAADRGLMYADRLGLDIDFLLGDYEKDYTDTHLAIMTAVQKGASDIYILGAIGTRMDHTMTNIGNMKAALDSGVNCHIVDKYNCIYLVNNDTGMHLIKKKEQYGKYVSIVPMSEEVVITLEGFKYCLNKYILKQGLSICQSNEIENDEASIIIHKGLAAIFETTD